VQFGLGNLVAVADASTSAVPARLGLKAPALAWPEAALAFSNPRPGQSRRPRLGPGLAWPRPRLLYVKIFNFFATNQWVYRRATQSNT
jgi:hypothetical protein